MLKGKQKKKIYKYRSSLQYARIVRF